MRTNGLRWLAHPVTLWVAFLLVHALISALGAWGPGQPIGDIRGFYNPWARDALNHGHVVGIDERWVYPLGALVPVLLPALVTHDLNGYIGAWYVMVAAVDAIAFALLLRHRSLRAVAAAWFWLGVILLLGPISLGRLDAVAAAVSIAGAVVIASRPVLASILIGFGAWVKAWPLAVLLAAFVSLRSRWRILAGMSGLSVVIVGVAVALGGAAQIFGPLFDQSVRGLQIESPAATPFLWLVWWGGSGRRIFYSNQTASWEISGPGTAAAGSLWTALLVVAVVASAALGLLALRGVVSRDGERGPLLAALSLALIGSLLSFDKVGSPQYQTWYSVPVVLGLLTAGRRWALPAGLALGSSLLTMVVYPYGYGQFTDPHAWVLTVFSIRNVLGFALLAWALAELSRLRVTDAAAAPARIAGDRA